MIGWINADLCGLAMARCWQPPFNGRQCRRNFGAWLRRWNPKWRKRRSCAALARVGRLISNSSYVVAAVIAPIPTSHSILRPVCLFRNCTEFPPPDSTAPPAYSTAPFVRRPRSPPPLYIIFALSFPFVLFRSALVQPYQSVLGFFFRSTCLFHLLKGCFPVAGLLAAGYPTTLQIARGEVLLRADHHPSSSLTLAAKGWPTLPRIKRAPMPRSYPIAPTQSFLRSQAVLEGLPRPKYPPNVPFS